MVQSLILLYVKKVMNASFKYEKTILKTLKLEKSHLSFVGLRNFNFMNAISPKDLLKFNSIRESIKYIYRYIIPQDTQSQRYEEFA